MPYDTELVTMNKQFVKPLLVLHPRPLNNMVSFFWYCCNVPRAVYCVKSCHGTLHTLRSCSTGDPYTVAETIIAPSRSKFTVPGSLQNTTQEQRCGIKYVKMWVKLVELKPGWKKNTENRTKLLAYPESRVFPSASGQHRWRPSAPIWAWTRRSERSRADSREATHFRGSRWSAASVSMTLFPWCQRQWNLQTSTWYW